MDSHPSTWHALRLHRPVQSNLGPPGGPVLPQQIQPAGPKCSPETPRVYPRPAFGPPGIAAEIHRFRLRVQFWRVSFEPLPTVSNERTPAMINAPYIPIWLDDAGLSKAAFRVLCHLWRSRNLKTGQCNPSAPRIARVCQVDQDKTLWKALRELESAGLIIREKRFRNSNHYRLLIPKRVTGKSGVTESSESPAKSSATHRKTQSVQSPAKAGCKGEQVKVNNEGSHTQGGDVPDFVSSVQAEHRDVDCVKCWEAFKDHAAATGKPLTRSRFDTWVGNEWKNVRGAAPHRSERNHGLKATTAAQHEKGF